MTVVYQISEYANYEFYHWFYFALASLYQIKDISGVVYYTVPHNNFEFQTESLKLLEHTYQCVNDSPLLKNTDITFQKLNPITLNSYNCPIQTEIYPFLRTNFLTKNTFESIRPLSRLIYISREKTAIKKRHVINESVFIPELIQRGFEIVYLEDFTFLEKVKLFLEARIVVTPSGGALSLGFFLNPDAVVIELVLNNIFTWSRQFNPIFKELNLNNKQYTNLNAVNKDLTIVTSINEYANLFVRDPEDFLKYIDLAIEFKENKI